MRRTQLGSLLSLAALCLSTTACVDSFSGAFVAVDFRAQLNENLVDAMTNPAVYGERRGGVTGPAIPGVLAQHQNNAPFASQAPPDTHFTLNWVENSSDADGNPVQFTFKATDFEIVPLVDLLDPCLVDTQPTDWPGIQAIAVQARLAEDLGFATPNDPNSLGPSDPVWDDLTENQQAQVFDAARRVDRLRSLAGRVLAVTSHDPFSSQDLLATRVDTTCANDPASDPGLIPPSFDPTQLPAIVPICYDDESNARRQELCREFFNETDEEGNRIHEDYYVGSDRVLSLPVNGTFFGTVYSLDPRISSGLARFVGANFQVEADMDKVDSLVVTWQFDDNDGDGEPDYPDTFPEEQRSPTGVVYLAGSATAEDELVRRGSIDLDLTNPVFPPTSAEGLFLRADASIFNNLDDDDLEF